MSGMAETPEQTEIVLQRELDAELPRKAGKRGSRMATTWQPRGLAGPHQGYDWAARGCISLNSGPFWTIPVRTGSWKLPEYDGILCLVTTVQGKVLEWYGMGYAAS